MAVPKPRTDPVGALVRRFALGVAIYLSGGAVLAQSGFDYRSIGAASTVFYNGPSEHARKVALASRYYPVEILINSGEWLKVRDSAGELAWVEAKNVSAKRMVIVTAASAQVRPKPEPSSTPAAQVERNVVLEFLEYTPGWVKVRHRDGVTGYIAIAEIWGA